MNDAKKRLELHEDYMNKETAADLIQYHRDSWGTRPSTVERFEAWDGCLNWLADPANKDRPGRAEVVEFMHEARSKLDVRIGTHNMFNMLWKYMLLAERHTLRNA